MNIARRTLYLSSMMLIAIMLVGFTSCASEDFFLEEGGKSLSLQVAATGQAQTRSLGEEDLNENLMERLDYFFFKADASNNATGELVYHITETNQTSQIDHEYSSGLSDELLTGLFGSTTPADRLYCYVYVVVNYDGFTNDNIAVGSTTLADIQNITFSTTLSTNAAQPSFVMAGGSPVQLRIVNGTYYRLATSRPIPVTRAAAKIDLVVTEVQQYTDEDPNDGSRWESHPENMYVMFYNGVSKSYIYADAGHYITNPENTDYFSIRGSNMRQMTETAEGSGIYEHSIPFYSYMSNWSNDADHMSCLILVLPWQHIDRDGNEIQDGYQSTYYQIPTSLDKRYLENHYYQIEVMIGMIGSFELPDPVILDNNTYMVVDWGTQNVSAAVRESVYLIVEKNKYTMNNVNTASIPYISSHEITEAYVTQIKYINTKTFETVTKTNTNDKDGTVSFNTYVNGETFTVDTENGLLTLTHEISTSQYTKYEVTVKIKNAKNLEEEVVFTIVPAIYVETHTGGDVFIDGRFGYVNNPTGGTWVRNGNSGSYYRSFNQRDDNYYIQTPYGTLETQNMAGSSLSQTSLTRISISNFNSTDEHFTITNGYGNSTTNLTYVITDPREPSNWNNNNLEQYVTGRTVRNNRESYNTTAWTNANNIKIGTSNQSAISPDFYISSSWGHCGQTLLSYEDAKKRCATYQEAGFPAGRWRLPTEAELMYIFNLQTKEVIPTLFNYEQGLYMASSGRMIYQGEFWGWDDIYYSHWYYGTYTAGEYFGGAFLRCVYDIWYWGDTPMSTNTYHVAP